MAIGTGLAILGSSLVGGFLQNRSAGKVADSQAAGQDAAIAEQRAAREQMVELLAPFREFGLESMDGLRDLLFNPDAGLEQINPVVDFLRKEGFEDIQESAAAGGRLGAGGTLKDLTQFNTDLTSTIVPQLQNQRFNQLFSVLGMGQNAAAGQGSAISNTANNISGFESNIGGIRGNEAINRSNALTGALSSFSQGVGSGMFNNLFSSSSGQAVANVGSGGANPNTVGFGSPF